MVSCDYAQALVQKYLEWTRRHSRVYVDEIPEENEEMAQEAAEGCPVSVIHIEED